MYFLGKKVIKLQLCFRKELQTNEEAEYQGHEVTCSRSQSLLAAERDSNTSSLILSRVHSTCAHKSLDKRSLSTASG